MDSSGFPASGTPSADRHAARAVGLLLFIFFLSLFSLTGSKLRFGYLGENIDQAEALISGSWSNRTEGGIVPFAKTGALEVAAYLPFAALKLFLETNNLLPGLRQLVYVFAEPFYTALLCLAFYGVSLRLYRKPSTAGSLALIFGLATMIWPYSKFGMETQITLWTVIGIWALLGCIEHQNPASAIWFALSVSALLLTKITGPLHAAMLLFSAVVLHWTARRNNGGTAFGHIGIVAGIVIAGIAIFLVTNRWRFGGWLWAGRYGYESEMQPFPLWESAWAFLASPNKSFFLYSPPALVALWFFASFFRRFSLMVPIYVGALLLTLFHLSARTWAEETWGPRRLHYLVPLMILPLGMWWERRHIIATPLRRIAWLAILFGVWVQFLAISFDYTALAFTLGHHPRFSQEHYLWDPQYNHLRFNQSLMVSAIHRGATGESVPYYLAPHYMGWTYDPAVDRSAPIPLASEAFDLSKYDQLGFWPLEQRRDWPDHPYWFVSLSSWLALALACMALISFTLLIVNVRNHHNDPAP